MRYVDFKAAANCYG